jgi:hypothetical protein
MVNKRAFTMDWQAGMDYLSAIDKADALVAQAYSKIESGRRTGE